MKKTEKKIEASAPASVRPASVSKTESNPQRALAPVDFARRHSNRQLATEKLLQLLRREHRNFFELAEVVGKWVWIQFPEKQPQSITAALSQLGFHWNRTRQSWQHPCGLFRDRLATFDPRRKYGSRFATDLNPA